MLGNARDEGWAFAWLATITVLLILLAIGEQVIAICTAYIITDSAAILNNPSCGVWFHYGDCVLGRSDERVRPPPVTTFPNFPNDRDPKSKSYAETCYHENARDGECSYFFSPTIPFQELYHDSCPFENGTCLDRSSGVYTLDTGYLDSGILGFNHPVRCEFRLQSTCSPLKAVEPYVQSWPGIEPGSLNVSYHFGNFRTPQQPTNLTMSQLYPSPTIARFKSLYKLHTEERGHQIL